MRVRQTRHAFTVMAALGMVSPLLSGGCVPADATGLETFVTDLLRSVASALLL